MAALDQRGAQLLLQRFQPITDCRLGQMQEVGGLAATVALGETPELSPASSTDVNLPLSLGIPSLRLGGGGVDGKNHSPEEWLDPTNAYLGTQKIKAD